MSLVELSRRHNDRQRAIANRAEQHVAQAWRTIDPHNIADSWIRQLPDAVGVLRQGKIAAANGSDDYVSAALQAQDTVPAPAGDVLSSAFAETATDGRPLGSLLYTPAAQAQAQIAAGAPVEQALSNGLNALQMITKTEVVDSGRQAVHVAMKVDRRVRGYYREVGAGACARCAILAGAWYSTAGGAGFERHPRCVCTAVAAADEAGRNPLGFSPQKYFANLSGAQQDKLFGRAGAQAIRDGADMSQVVNARRGMSEIGSWGTTEGTTKSGYYAYVQRAIDRAKGQETSYTARNLGQRGYVKNYTERRVAQQRLTPETIYRIAGDDRDLTIRMLTENGYVLPAKGQTITDVARSTIPKPVALRPLAELTDDELALELATDDEHRIDQVVAELDRRDAVAKKAAADKERRAGQKAAKQAEQDALYERLLEDGVNPEDAFAEAFGVESDQQRRDAAVAQLRATGYTGRSFDELTSRAFKDEADRQYFAAEDATRGNVINAAGVRADVSAISLFTGPESRARKYASEELLQWWQDNERLTLENFRAGLLGEKVSGAKGGYWL
ncbi:MAG: hypothetical protein ACRDLM_12235 [Gaiellaceae bacterium]